MVKAVLSCAAILAFALDAQANQPGQDRLRELVRALQGGDTSEQAEAAVRLGALGPAGRAAVPALVEALRSDSPFVVTAAADALDKIEPGNPAAVAALTKVLRRRPL